MIYFVFEEISDRNVSDIASSDKPIHCSVQQYELRGTVWVWGIYSVKVEVLSYSKDICV